MLCNNLDPQNAEKPQELIVYGGTGKAARDWPCFDALVQSLLDLEDDETLLVQSGKPVGVVRTHRMSPRVLIANSNLVPRWATWEHFHDLEARGLMMYGQMTAGSWIYIGTQGILQGTYETFAALAEKHFGATLAGRIVVSAGLGGMGGAQPLAVTMNGGVMICVDLLNSGICPVVPEKGSVGASGDLAPMAHLALVLIGQGEAFYRGARMSGSEALSAAGLAPVRLDAGEGLALINGTQFMAGIGALAVSDAARLARTADIACSISLEVLMGTNVEFDPRIHKARPHPGQAAVADNMYRITQDSAIMSSHKDCHRIQDAYTLRCSPQVHGASRDAISHVRGVFETELASCTTNPLVFPETGDFLLGGNFHGQPLALAADYLCMAASELASISERRIERLVNPQLSGLPAFLVNDSGLNSGFMIAQYTAAALVSENKVLSHPACVDSIPTSANKEDHVSMGTISVRKCRSVIANAEAVIAVELLCGCQALDLLTKGRPGRGTEAAYRIVRQRVPRLDRDRVLSRDIEAMVDLLRDGAIIRAVEEAVGPIP